MEETPDEKVGLKITLPIYNEVGKEEEVTYSDKGEALVVRRALSATLAKNDDWLRNKIFHIRYTSHSKVCNIIIDGVVVKMWSLLLW